MTKRIVHGQSTLPSVTVGPYSLEIQDGEGFIGDRASRSAFLDILHVWRRQFKRMDGGSDPLGSTRTKELRGKIDEFLREDEAAAHTVTAAIEDYAHQLAHVALQFMKQPSWRGVQRIIVGGGFEDSEAGKLAIARVGHLLSSQAEKVDIRLLHHHPDEGGLVGWAHVVPSEDLRAMEAFLAVDIGGTNVRCGVVRPNIQDADDLRNAEVIMREKWSHADDGSVVRRADVVDGIVEMLQKLTSRADEVGIELAPFVGVACPGRILKSGEIGAGTQNLPGNWESSSFHLPSTLAAKLPRIRGRRPRVVLHNDAVVQGLSQRPFTSDVKKWAVMTIGTGLGNATFVNG